VAGKPPLSQRQQKVLRYIIGRINEGAPLQEVLQEQYVLCNCSRSEIEQIIRSPELIGAPGSSWGSRSARRSSSPKPSRSENPSDFLFQYFVNSPHTRRSTPGAVLEGRYTSQVLYGGRVRVSRILELRDYDIYAICQRYKPRLALPAPSV
jgi:hypothetical protein